MSDLRSDSPPLTTRRQAERIAELGRLAGLRAREEVELRRRRDERRAAATAEHQTEREQARTEFEAEHGRQIEAYRKIRETLFHEYETQGQALASAEQTTIEADAQRHEQAVAAELASCEALEASIRGRQSEKEQAIRADLAQFRERCDWCLGELDAIVESSVRLLRRRSVRGGVPDGSTAPTSPPGLPHQEYAQRAIAGLDDARRRLALLQTLPAARFVDDGWPIMIFVFAAALAAYPIWLAFTSDQGPLVVAAALLAPPATAFVARLFALRLARRQSERLAPEQFQTLARARADVDSAWRAASLETEKSQRKLAESCEKDRATARGDHAKAQGELERRRRVQQERTAAEFARRRRELESTQIDRIERSDAQQLPAIERTEQEFARRLDRSAERFRRRRAEADEEFARAWNELAERWRSGVADFAQEVARMNAYAEARFPAWSRIAESPGDASHDSPAPAVVFGRHRFDLAGLPDGISTSADLQVSPTTFELPAVLSYPDCPSLLLEADDEGREAAVVALRSVMLRLLTAFPPGKVRFTIVDPVGLGQNFSAFMHLADFDERLVSNRIWTEAAHINQRLADLTEHMENVIQKYLRNEFASIQEYNAQAGEVAEPYQILVIANFPANFSDEAARRLTSIASSGARCGVYTLISVDTKLKLPRNFDLADLERRAATLVWDRTRQAFRRLDPELASLPLEIESPPDDERTTQILKCVGRAAKDAARVEVPFETIVPSDEHWWTSDSRAEIEVPLGRAGAKKLQFMRLGKGTSQHVLISGKTGSGKSTLLNAIITSLAVHYSPRELQFFLIDFKKGVEFKAYATKRLPHARVIAIESEREFGMSVLERLDLELQRRGDLFRQFGVQDLKSYRNAAPEATLPRLLLVIDEFQEFFTSDDRISHDAALLLDRLVRQGRAFGIHVLLGSQTLAGAYSLARSTIGQMAVRIALQCGEADAHLILSEDNSAARLLSRPGEAIYNDANGLFEGNHPFQVVWLPDEQREAYLDRLAELAHARRLDLPPPTVFEGGSTADPAENVELRRRIEQVEPARGERTSVEPQAWLGSAVAIKDPTSVRFRRQGGANLLVVGAREELAIGVLASCLTSLAPARRAEPGGGDDGPPRGVYIFDGARPESPEQGFWRRTAERLGAEARVVASRDVDAAIGRLADEVDRRLAAGSDSDRPAAEPLFLLIYNLARFRELRKDEDFSFSNFDESSSGGSSKRLAKILREGPSVGVHTLVWCDSYNSVSRWFDRATLRDFEMRVLFQMNANDSSSLMDGPAASKLSAHLAICYSEEHGQSEKFRPYGPPSDAWLDWIASRRCGGVSTPPSIAASPG